MQSVSEKIPDWLKVPPSRFCTMDDLVDFSSQNYDQEMIDKKLPAMLKVSSTCQELIVKDLDAIEDFITPAVLLNVFSSFRKVKMHPRFFDGADVRDVLKKFFTADMKKQISSQITPKCPLTSVILLEIFVHFSEISKQLDLQNSQRILTYNVKQILIQPTMAISA